MRNKLIKQKVLAKLRESGSMDDLLPYKIDLDERDLKKLKKQIDDLPDHKRDKVREERGKMMDYLYENKEKGRGLHSKIMKKYAPGRPPSKYLEDSSKSIMKNSPELTKEQATGIAAANWNKKTPSEKIKKTKEYEA